MMIRLALLLILTLVFPATYGQNIFSNNFNHLTPNSAYTEARLNSDWNTPPWSDGVATGENRVFVVPDGAGGSALEVRFPANMVGTKETGAQWRYIFGETYEALELSYRFRFGPNFIWSRGGKLPGLAGSTRSNFSTSNTDNSWAGRIMWRENGTAVSYAFHKDSGINGDGSTEDRIFWDNFNFVPDRWYQFTERIRMNTPGVNDGQLELLIDGQRVHFQNDIRWRDSADLKIDQMFFSTFFGGSDATWNTQKDEVIYFDDFSINTLSDPPAIQDQIEIVASPSQVEDGASVNVGLQIDMAQAGFAHVNILTQNNQWLGGASTPLTAGTHSITLPVQLRNSAEADTPIVYNAFISTVRNDWRNARDWSPPTTGTIIATAAPFQVSIVSAPSTIAAGSTISADLNATMAQAGYAHINVITTSGAWLGGASTSLSSGNHQFTLNFPISSAVAPGTNIEYHTFLSQTRGDWQNAHVFGTRQPGTISVAAPPSYNIAITSIPDVIQPGATIDVGLDVTLAQPGYANISLLSNSQWVAGRSIFLNSSQSITIRLTVPANLPVGANLRFDTFVSANQGDWRNAFRFGSPVQSTVSAPGGGTPTVNSVAIATAPNEIVPSSSVDVTLNVAMAQAGYVNLNALVQNSGQWIGGTSRFLNAGNHRVTLSLPITAAAPIGQTFRLSSFISVLERDWQASLDWAPEVTGAIVAESWFGNNQVSIVSAPLRAETNQQLSVDVKSNLEEAGYISVSLVDSNSTEIDFQTVAVPMGKSISTIQLETNATENPFAYEVFASSEPGSVASTTAIGDSFSAGFGSSVPDYIMAYSSKDSFTANTPLDITYTYGISDVSSVVVELIDIFSGTTSHSERLTISGEGKGTMSINTSALSAGFYEVAVYLTTSGNTTATAQPYVVEIGAF